MTLSEWLAQKGRRAKTELHRATKLRWATIHDIANGHIPRVETAKKIEEATGGEVTAAEILGIVSTVASSDAPEAA